MEKGAESDKKDASGLSDASSSAKNPVQSSYTNRNGQRNQEVATIAPRPVTASEEDRQTKQPLNGMCESPRNGSSSATLPLSVLPSRSVESDDGRSNKRGTASKRDRSNLRKGKWTVEEEEYTSRIIHYFSTGLLTLPEGATLRSYLADKLNCDPMRITKKYSGASCLGRRVYHFHDRPQPTVGEIQFARAELDHLEQRFRMRVEEGHSGLPLPAAPPANVMLLPLLQQANQIMAANTPTTPATAANAFQSWLMNLQQPTSRAGAAGVAAAAGAPTTFPTPQPAAPVASTPWTMPTAPAAPNPWINPSPAILPGSQNLQVNDAPSANALLAQAAQAFAALGPALGPALSQLALNNWSSQQAQQKQQQQPQQLLSTLQPRRSEENCGDSSAASSAAARELKAAFEKHLKSQNVTAANSTLQATTAPNQVPIVSNPALPQSQADTHSIPVAQAAVSVPPGQQQEEATVSVPVPRAPDFRATPSNATAPSTQLQKSQVQTTQALTKTMTNIATMHQPTMALPMVQPSNTIQPYQGGSITRNATVEPAPTGGSAKDNGGRTFDDGIKPEAQSISKITQQRANQTSSNDTTAIGNQRQSQSAVGESGDDNGNEVLVLSDAGTAEVPAATAAASKEKPRTEEDKAAGTILMGFLSSLRSSYEEAIRDKDKGTGEGEGGVGEEDDVARGGQVGEGPGGNALLTSLSASYAKIQAKSITTPTMAVGTTKSGAITGFVSMDRSNNRGRDDNKNHNSTGTANTSTIKNKNNNSKSCITTVIENSRLQGSKRGMTATTSTAISTVTDSSSSQHAAESSMEDSDWNSDKKTDSSEDSDDREIVQQAQHRGFKGGLVSGGNSTAGNMNNSRDDHHGNVVGSNVGDELSNNKNEKNMGSPNNNNNPSSSEESDREVAHNNTQPSTNHQQQQHNHHQYYHHHHRSRGPPRKRLKAKKMMGE